ncbi:MAG: M23 family peptidase, partial [Acidimicrobiia bacterium]
MPWLLALALTSGALVPTCTGLAAPVGGPVIRAFAPVGAYGGHWGIDFGVEVGTTVRTAAPGEVTFAGTVAGNRTVTVHHGGGV